MIIIILQLIECSHNMTVHVYTDFLDCFYSNSYSQGHVIDVRRHLWLIINKQLFLIYADNELHIMLH